MIAIADAFAPLLPDTAHADVLFDLARKNTDCLEQLTDLNLGLWRAMLDDASTILHQVAQAKDVQDLIQAGNAQLKPRAEQAMTYLRHVNDICADLRANLSSVAEARVEENNTRMASLVENAAKNAPAGAAPALELFKSAMGNTNAGLLQLTRTTRQAVEAMEINMAAVVSRMTDASEKNGTRRARK